ncbi:MAG: ABC transporter permease, partial [Firmicutes bacterium]|nr:ABC transporter permease [Bacillota bacterium]
IDEMMQSLNYIIILVILCAGALAFIVLFNLSNINLTERVREIATIEVLGFYPRETGAYVFRENLILVILGIIAGLPTGMALHRFIMKQIQVDMVSFENVIEPHSYIYTIITVLVFTFIVDRVMRLKLKKINMAEALKSIE